MIIGPDHDAFVYSPQNWAVDRSAARSINPGAYLRIVFTGPCCTLLFDADANGADAPEIYYAVDREPKIRVAVRGSAIRCEMPPATAGWRRHLLELWLKSMSRGAARFPVPEAMLAFKGVELAADASVHRPIARDGYLLVMGDSITEGLLAGDPGGATAADQDDALRAFAYQLGDHLGLEVGVVGFSGQGLTIAGDCGIPPFPLFYETVLPGTARSFRPEPTLIVLNLGTNDGVKTRETTAVTRALSPVLRDLLRRTTRTKLVVLQPFGKYLTRELRRAVRDVGDPRCIFLPSDVSGDDLVDGYHPSGSASLVHIAPRVANDLRAVLREPGRRSGAWRFWIRGRTKAIPD